MPRRAAVGVGHHASGTHCGVYYESDEHGKVEFLHLRDHNSLASDEPSASYYNVPSRLVNRAEIVVSDLCRLVFAKHGSKGLRFAMTRSDGFLSNADLKLDQPGTGFTCATLVKSIFEAAAYPLVEAKTWPAASQEDRNWAEAVKRYFAAKASAQTQAHAAKIDPFCKWSRFRPEQLAVAASKAPPPATYGQVKRDAELLVPKIKATVPAITI